MTNKNEMTDTKMTDKKIDDTKIKNDRIKKLIGWCKMKNGWKKLNDWAKYKLTDTK
jgi:hypothetical protein